MSVYPSNPAASMLVLSDAVSGASPRIEVFCVNPVVTLPLNKNLTRPRYIAHVLRVTCSLVL